MSRLDGYLALAAACALAIYLMLVVTVRVFGSATP